MNNFNGDGFQQDVLNAKEPVLVDFWAPWCGPCKMIGPVVEEIANEYVGKIKVGKVNVDENQDLAARYSVMSIPTVCLFVQGKVAEQFVGFRPKKELTAAIDKHLT